MNDVYICIYKVYMSPIPYNVCAGERDGRVTVRHSRCRYTRVTRVTRGSSDTALLHVLHTTLLA